MGLKSKVAHWLAKKEAKAVARKAMRPHQNQAETFSYLLRTLSKTSFGKDHGIHENMDHEAWTKAVPLRDYEGLRSYIDRIQLGEKDVLWSGSPKYLCKTSGTTSGVKFIPMSDEGIKAQVKAARSALMCYMAETGNARFVDGKMIFLQGSPELNTKNGVQIGRLSGIVAHHVPSYLQSNRLPSWQVNTMSDWEKKVDAVVEETHKQDLRLVSGIPPWIQMYFERLLAKTGKKTVKEVFPNLSVFAHGGVNYAPYRATLEGLIGERIDTIETYPASEGFIAYQDSQKEEGLLLNLEAGIFYEFIPLDQIHEATPTRLTLKEVELGVNYALVLNTSSGLWGYVLGDTVKFVSTAPYRLVVSGRIKHFISAFGEHVIGEEVENAMSRVCDLHGIQIQEFHVAPQVNPTGGLPYHEWIIESDEEIPETVVDDLDKFMCELNPYYMDLIHGKVLRSLKVTPVKKGVFNAFMKAEGKLGGQNKLPRLSNDRSIADRVLELSTH